MEDRLLQKVVRNTGYLFSSNTLSAGLSSLQGILAAYLLGPEGYGLIGMTISLVTNVNRLLSFRMSEVTIKFAGQYLELEQKEKAAAVVKAAGILEALTSTVAYLVLLLLAPLAATYILKDTTAASWIMIYGLIILANMVTETSTAVLNIGGHFRTQAAINFIQSLMVTILIGAVFLTKGGFSHILLAYTIGKFFIGIAMSSAALFWARRMLGKGWWKVSFKNLTNWREMGGFVISTNLSGTLNLIIRDSEVLWIGYFLNPLYAGYYKFGLAIMNVILMPISPFIATTYPEINRSIARKNWKQLRDLLKRTTLIAAVWTLGCAAGLAIVGPFFLNWFKDGAYLLSLPAALILVAGYGVANIFFWNRNLMLAFNMPNYPLIASFWAGLGKTVLMFLLVRQYGYLAQAALMSGFFVISVSAIVWRGLKELKHRELTENLPEQAAEGT